MMREKDKGEKTVTRELSLWNQVTICFLQGYIEREEYSQRKIKELCQNDESKKEA